LRGVTEYFVDTNVFLRFLTNDDPLKARKSELLFRAAIEGKKRLRTSVLVIAEIVWTLESFYGLEKSDIAEKVAIILNTRNLACDGAPLIRQALDLYSNQNIDFIDAYHAFYLREESIRQIISYDRKHFGRVKWLELSEP
jgi:predicted nucleic-acid-binding protein